MPTRAGRLAAGLGRVHPLSALVWLAFLGALLAAWRLAPDEAAVRAGFEALGAAAPAAYVLAEIAQIIIIPIPGQPFEISGGWLVGLVPGLLLGSLGALAGSLAAFALGRRFGRDWVERRVAEKTRRRFRERIGGDEGAGRIVFWLMLVPAFPRDPLCYLAGLTGLSGTRFTLIAAVGRPVGLAPWVTAGALGVEAGLRLQFALAAAAGAAWLGAVALRALRRRIVVAAPQAIHPGVNPHA